MGDDAATVEQLRAELRRYRDRAETAEAQNASLRHTVEQRDWALAEAVEQQAATAEILRVIATPGQDLHATLHALQARAELLLDAGLATFFRVHGGVMRRVAYPENDPPDARWADYPIDRRRMAGRVILDRRPHRVRSMCDDDEVGELDPDTRALMRRNQEGSYLGVPLMRGDEAIGVLQVFRQQVRPFTDGETALLETFADQAVIAIENARLFAELERRNAELQESNRQVTEALEQQTATAEVLKVIASSPTNLPGVLDTIVVSAARLCDADQVFINLVEGDEAVRVASVLDDADAPLPMGTRFKLAQGGVNVDAITQRRTLSYLREHVPDSLDAPYFPRALVAVPLHQGQETIGALIVTRRQARKFSERETSLLETFADQAVIAIENARLFEELTDRTAALTRTLEQQMALSEVLRVIASSPTDLPKMGNNILDSSTR
jgi:GAF domain-containing protein